MLTTLLIAGALLQGQGQDVQNQPPQVDPATIVSKMIARYYGANSMVGQIRLTQTAMGRSVVVTTDLHFQLPNKIFLRQVKQSQADPAVRLLTSDGTRFSYDPPETVLIKENARLIEAVKTPGKPDLVIQDMYAAFSGSLVDPSMPLDVAIGRRERLEFRRNQWASLKYVGKEKLGDLDVHVIEGRWREYKSAPPSADFQMLITEEGDLKRYAMSEVVQVRAPNGAGLDPQQIMSVWEVNLTPNGTPDASLFKLVK